MKKLQTLLCIFIASGLIFLVIGTAICIKTFDYTGLAKTLATVTDIVFNKQADGDARYETYVSYEVNGISYEKELGGYMSFFEVGDEIEIYYDINDPESIGSKATDKALLALPLIGLVFVFIGGIPLIIYRRRGSPPKLNQTAWD